METKYFEQMLGKKVTVRTMDDYIMGVLTEIDGDVLLIEKQRKNGTDKFFVNKSYVSMIAIKD